jgi:DNA-binding CsgD family transcriptional regulator
VTEWKPGQAKPGSPAEGALADRLLARWRASDDWVSGLDRLQERMNMLPHVAEHEVDTMVDVGRLGFTTMFKPVHLSGRELQLLEALANGMQSAEWAASVGISPITAHNHASRMKVRMRAKTRTHAVAMAVEAGLVRVALRPGVPRNRIYMRRGLSRPLMENLWHVARGLSNEEIAEKRGLSGETIKTQMRTLYEILGARGRAHAVAIAFSLGLLHYGKEQDV